MSVRELIHELFFGFSKHTPDEMPDIEYASCFTIKYPAKKAVMRICIAAVITLVFSVLWILIKDQTRYLFVVFSLLGGILLVLSLFSLSFECTVDEYAIRYAYYGVLFKKEIKWQDVLCVRTVERHHEKDVTVVLYDNDGNGIATFSSEMENVWYVVKMAEHQGIEVKKEKDLTLNEIRHL